MSSLNTNNYFTSKLTKFSTFNSLTKPDETLLGLPRGEVGLLIAPGATGKSYFILNILFASIGLTKNHLVPKKLRILYVSLEDRLDDINHRLTNYKEALSLEKNNLSGISDDFEIIAYKGISRLIVKNSMEIHTPLWVELDAYINSSKIDLVIIDTLIKTYEGFDENSNPDMSVVLSHFNELAIRNKCSILLLHHTNKGAINRDSPQSQSDSRGASSIVDNSRWVVSLRKNNDETGVVCQSVKTNFCSSNSANYRRAYKGALVMEDDNAA